MVDNYVCELTCIQASRDFILTYQQTHFIHFQSIIDNMYEYDYFLSIQLNSDPSQTGFTRPIDGWSQCL